MSDDRVFGEPTTTRPLHLAREIYMCLHAMMVWDAQVEVALFEGCLCERLSKGHTCAHCSKDLASQANLPYLSVEVVCDADFNSKA